MITAITNAKLALNTWGGLTFAPATAAADGVAIDMTGKDFATVILAKNGGSAAATVTVKAGDGIQGIKDIAAYSIAAGATAAIRLDSGAFKNVLGTNKGKAVIIPSSTDITFAVVELP